MKVQNHIPSKDRMSLSDEAIKEGDLAAFGSHVGKVVKIYSKSNIKLIQFDNSDVDVQYIHCKKIISS